MYSLTTRNLYFVPYVASLRVLRASSEEQFLRTFAVRSALCDTQCTVVLSVTIAWSPHVSTTVCTECSFI